MKLDLSGLERLAARRPGTPQDASGGGDGIKIPYEGQKPSEGLVGALGGMGRLRMDAERKRREELRVAEVYKQYQKNLLAANRLQTEILMDVKSGADGYALFLKAAKAISLMTGDELFYRQVEEGVARI